LFAKLVKLSLEIQRPWDSVLGTCMEWHLSASENLL